MPTPAYKASGTRRTSAPNYVRPTPSQLAALRRAKKTLSAKLAIDVPQLSKAAKAAAARVLESAMDELIADLNQVSREPREIEHDILIGAGGAKSASVKPTPGLRRAMTEAGKIKRGRFGNPDELFGSLGQK